LRLILSILFALSASAAYAQSYGSPVIQGVTIRGCTGYLKGNGTSAATCSATIPGSALGAGAAVANLGYTPLNPASNLSDVANAATARTNIGAATALGFTPANIAGDTFTGNVNLSSGQAYQINGTPVLTGNVQGTGVPGLDGGHLFYWNAPSTVDDTWTLRTDRNPSYTGGTAGHVGSASWANCTVGAAVVTHEWCGLDTLKNYAATAGQNVARYMQAWRYSGGRATWASVSEARDMTSTADPTYPLLGTEIDILANGTDANSNRLGVDIVGGKGVAGGASSVAYAGWRVSPSNGTVADSTFNNGGLLMGQFVNGLNLANGAFSGQAIALPPEGKIAFDAGCTDGAYPAAKCAFVNSSRQMYYSTGSLVYHTPSGNVITIADNGDILVAGALTAGSALKIAKVAVASLPTCNSAAEGTLFAVTDANSATFNAAIASGGANHVMAYCNGTTWTVH
jgi:hypothetical protein